MTWISECRQMAPLLVISTGILARLLHLASMPANPRTYYPGPDEDYYIRFGMDVAEGPFGMTPEFLFMDPLYGYLLGLLFSLFGKNLFLVYLLQVVVDSITIGVVYLIGKEVWSRRAGLVAAACYGLAATAIFYSTTVLKEGLVTPYFALWTYLSLRLWRSQPRHGIPWGWLGYGAFLGIGVALRANLLLMALLGLAAVPLANGLNLRSGFILPATRFLSVMAGLSAILALLAFRGASISGEWSFMPTNGGLVLHHLYNPENPEAQHQVPAFVNHLLPSEILQSYQIEAERRLGRTLGPHEMSGYWRQEALDYLLNHPIQTLGNSLRKAFEFTSYKEVANNRALNEGEYFSRVLTLLPRPFGWLLALGLPGLMLLALRSPKGWLLLAGFGVVLVTFVFFFAVDRFRLPAIPLLAVGVGVAVDSLSQWRSRPRREAAWLLAGAVLLGSLSFWSSARLSEPRPDDFMHSWTWGYLKMGDLKSAHSLSELLLQRYPDNYRSHDVAGYLALLRNEPAQAARHYEQALRLNPTDHVLLFNRAVVLEQLGQYEQALAAVDGALGQRELPEYLFRKASVLASLGRREESQSLYRKLTDPTTAARGTLWRQYAEEARPKLHAP